MTWQQCQSVSPLPFAAHTDSDSNTLILERDVHANAWVQNKTVPEELTDGGSMIKKKFQPRVTLCQTLLQRLVPTSQLAKWRAASLLRNLLFYLTPCHPFLPPWIPSSFLPCLCLFLPSPPSLSGSKGWWSVKLESVSYSALRLRG